MERMSTRLTWVLGLIVLISIAFLMACGSHYSSSSDGLVIVPSQGSEVLQAFSFNLSTGHMAQINTAPAVQGKPTAIILDPAGSFAYVAILPDPANPNPVTAASIASYKVDSNGTLAANGTPVSMTPLVTGGTVSPVAFAMDSAGKFLFVADQATTDSSGAAVAGSVSVFAISNGGVTEVPGSPFGVPSVLGGTNANVLALAVTPTVFPTQTAACAGASALTTQNLYVADNANNRVFEYSVDPSTGTLTPVQALNGPGVATGVQPSGIAVDPCNRFVYVSNFQSNSVSGYAMCNTVSLPNCPSADGSLLSVGAAAPAGNGPIALAVDPFGNFVYVVDNLQNAISAYQISSATGVLTALSPATVSTGSNPVSIAIRADDNWLFVTSNGSAALSQYSITPATGALATLSGATTDTFPWGVAVK
jgi:6-phosphogluconolactonase (cycloisomerase 2 family)